MPEFSNIDIDFTHLPNTVFTVQFNVDLSAEIAAQVFSYARGNGKVNIHLIKNDDFTSEDLAAITSISLNPPGSSIVYQNSVEFESEEDYGVGGGTYTGEDGEPVEVPHTATATVYVFTIISAVSFAKGEDNAS